MIRLRPDLEKRYGLMGNLQDEKMKHIVYANVNMLVPWFLMAAYAYEVKDSPILSDGAWDELCEELRLQWSSVRHRHKYIIDRHQLKTGTAHYLSEDDYPSLAVAAANNLIQEMSNGKEERRRLRRRHRRLSRKVRA